MASIDPTARIESGAVIGEGVSVGPYCVVGPHVSLGAGCRLVAHVHIAGHTTVGPRTVIYPFASLGTPPQSSGYRGEPTTLSVGADCQIRESVTMNLGTVSGGGITTIGDRNFFMVGTHVGHDCHVGNDVIMANNAVLGGHVTVGDRVVFGGQAAVHQFTRIGEGAMIAGVSGVRGDVIPYGHALGQRAVLVGLNVVGMKRRGFSRQDLHRVRAAYRALFSGDGTLRERIDAVVAEYGDDPVLAKLVDFLRDSKGRQLLQPERGRSTEAADADAAP
jgi:UDP-N-acetylglucosamine acyltransferase